MSDPKAYQRVVVAGAGAWGTALALLLARAGREVTIWTRNAEVADVIARTGVNETYLPDVELPPAIRVETTMSVMADADALVCVIPTQHIRTFLPQFRAACPIPSVPVALCCKGIERNSGAFVHDVLADVWPEAGASLLSGPSFAADVARGLPTAVTLADRDVGRASRWQATFRTQSFRPYLSDDVTGVALGGAAKNVLAIACGVVDGAGLGESAKAALMARGFAELLRLAVAVGATPETLNGLSGLGDIILTCSSTQSRNFSLGVDIGAGRPVAELLSGRTTVAEGAATAPVLAALANAHGVEMPVVDAVTGLLAGTATMTETVARLMSRPLKAKE